MKVRPIFFVALIACGCINNPNRKPVIETTPTSTDFQKAEALFYSNTKKDSAFYYFTNVTQNSKDSLLIAMAYSFMAMIQDDAGDYFGGQESALEALKHVDEKNPQHHYCLSSIYNELGVNSAGLENYSSAVEYYELAIKFQQDEAYKMIFLNNKAVAYRKKGDYQQAIRILDSLMEKQRNNKLAYARALTNLASTKWMADSAFYPVPEFLTALNIRKHENNDIGVASSYNHLSDYYLYHHPDSALFYADSMYKLAQQVNSADQKLDALRKLVLLSPGVQSKAYFRQYRYLSDSVVTARNKAKNQFALIKYQSEKNKAENSVLQKDNSEKELKILQQQIWMYGILVIVIIIVVFVFWWARKKKQQIEWESQAAIRDNHLKTSQKVHDIVANGLYRIMNEIEHKEEIEREQLLERIDQLYERSRDISYEPSAVDAGTGDRINELLTCFATPETSVAIVGNQEEIWHNVTPQAAKEIEHVLQELMINMTKHSKAHHVVVRFGLTDAMLTISYRDDGIGFGPEIKPGNGLKSTGNRIERMGGELIFVSESTGGVSIKIVIPINTT